MKQMVKFVKFASELDEQGTPDTQVPGRDCTVNGLSSKTLQMAAHYLLTYVAQEGLTVRSRI